MNTKTKLQFRIFHFYENTRFILYFQMFWTESLPTNVSLELRGKFSLKTQVRFSQEEHFIK